VTTEKDAVRLDGWRPRAASLAVLRVALEVVPEKLLLDRVLRACRPEAAA
jgi:tetraacyldisaccharide-1-P 4'-kinase